MQETDPPPLKAPRTATERRVAPADRPRVAVVIPALDEEQALGEVLRELHAACAEHPDFHLVQVVVADNGSRDRTAQVAREHGASVVSEPRRGYGAACLRGLAALGEVDAIVFLDADRSDHPDELPALLAPILRGEADLVIGSRVLGRAEPGSLTVVQRFGNGLSSRLLRWIWGLPCTDLGPFRAVAPDALRRVAMADLGYGWTVEMQARAARLGLRVHEVPVRYRRRIGRSKISGTVRGVFGAGTKILWTIAREALDAGWERLMARQRGSGARSGPGLADAEEPLLSVVIPALDEEEHVEAAVASARPSPAVEVLVVDGGSLDRTVERATAAGARVLQAAPGRASQQNAGAAAARGRWLLFLHADTRLPYGYLDEVARLLSDPRVALGAFRFALDRVEPGLRAIELGANLRSRLLSLPFGDQALFLRRESFERDGPFPPLPILEDYELVRRLRRTGRVRLARTHAITSARRWQSAGKLRTSLLHTLLPLAHRLGVPAATLARWRTGER